MCLASALLLVADLLSPGPLAKAHEKLEGLKSCTQCHIKGGQLSSQRCLDCHTALNARIAKGVGFHGRMTQAERDCAQCHHEHQGRDFALIDWGAQGARAFDHRKTGFDLKGKHTGLDCAKCHLKQETFLGAQSSCSACHADEHRGQLGNDCARCHAESGWKPAPLFVHAKTAFPLLGKHAAVACEKCHAREQGFERFKPVAHESCTACHQDPHAGRLGTSCQQCHTVGGWHEVKAAAGERAFHEKTRFPLRGAHAAVACEACHGKPAVYRNLKFERCSDCHLDAHAGQLPGRDCDGCHSLQSFAPARYEAADHRGWPLEGAHVTVACLLCHARDDRLRPRKVQRLFSLALFKVKGGRCEECHRDPHAGQFAPDGCAQCHQPASFHEAKFDHARFPLDGGHQGVACAECHFGGKYRGAPTECASCHSDPHAAQLGSDCARCHLITKFQQTRFAHAPPFTAFALTGKHAPLACEKCHAQARVPAKLVRYEGTPQSCAGCHADFHKGAFGPDCAKCHSTAAFAAVSFDHAKTGFLLEGRHAALGCRACHAGGDFQRALPRSCAGCHQDVHQAEFGARCEGCHDPRSWQSRFDAEAHRRTNFPLLGRHALVACEECHLDTRGRGFTRAAVSCERCHAADYARTAGGAVDHAASGFPMSCGQCHGAYSFRGARFAAHAACFQIDAGPHAGIACLDCHTRLQGAAAIGTCGTGTASCIRCHACASTDRRHAEVSGYQCKDRKCYECHSFLASSEPRRGLRR